MRKVIILSSLATLFVSFSVWADATSSLQQPTNANTDTKAATDTTAPAGSTATGVAATTNAPVVIPADPCKAIEDACKKVFPDGRTRKHECMQPLFNRESVNGVKIDSDIVEACFDKLRGNSDPMYFKPPAPLPHSEKTPATSTPATGATPAAAPQVID